MKNRQLALTLGIFLTATFFIVSSCKKINEATELGSGLIPPIDNINTFDTSLTVEAFNGLFTVGGTDPLSEDSTRSIFSDRQYLGRITADPLFGSTDARMFFELKPEYYKYTFFNRPDSLNLDSIVLILDWQETYGDTLANQTVNVYEMPLELRTDTTFLIREDPFAGAYGPLLGSRTFSPQILNDSVKAFRDTTANQLRIRLSDSFGTRLLEYDTTSSMGWEDGYSSDSVFRSKFHGFVLQSVSGNAVMGFNLSGPNTKLAIYYRDDNGNSTVEDTTVAYFSFNVINSAVHNYVDRDYTGTPLLAAQGGITPDPLVYIQNTPGSFATLKIPALAGLNNRVVHLAELITEQVYDISDSTFPPPATMFLDLYDPSLARYKFMMVPYDVVFDGASSFNFGTFGVNPINAVDISGHVIRTWHFNLTRYIQHVVNDTEPVYDMRLFSPYRVTDYYRPPAIGSEASAVSVTLNSTPVLGRVRLSGTTMKLRIVYSKL